MKMVWHKAVRNYLAYRLDIRFNLIQKETVIFIFKEKPVFMVPHVVDMVYMSFFKVHYAGFLVKDSEFVGKIQVLGMVSRVVLAGVNARVLFSAL
jgi:hypothetical protein